MKTKTTFRFLLLIVLFGFNSISAQDIGKIFTSQKADSLFGPVLESSAIKSFDLYLLLKKSPNYIMFNILNKQLYVLDAERNVLYPEGGSVKEDVKFHLFSSDLVNELMLRGEQTTTFVEMRNQNLTITNGASTLEFSSLCPPFCP